MDKSQMKILGVISFIILQLIASPTWAGSLVSWGSDYTGQVRDTPAGSDFEAVAASQWNSLALRSDGSLVTWSRDGAGIVSNTPTGYDFVAVAAGANHNLALRSDGSIAAWGLNDYHQVSDTPTGNDFVALAAGHFHCVALKSDGSLVAWGGDVATGHDGIAGQVSDTPTGYGFVAVSTTGYHNVALKSDGSLVAWGHDTNGQVSNTPTGNDFVAVAAGMFHNVALKTDGSLVAWGYDFYGQVSNTPTGNDFVAITAGTHHNVALKSDGSLVAWGDDAWDQVSNTPAGNNITAVAAGWAHSVAIIASTSGVPVHRFWSPVTSRHFYTISETEKQIVIDTYSHVWTYEGVAYRAFDTESETGLVPVYRFWSPVLSGHFYTADSAERDILLNTYPDVWTYEGPAFYAYPAGAAPAGTRPVYRFWSDSLSGHFYTIDETERDILLSTYSHVWTYEDIAWYAYPNETQSSPPDILGTYTTGPVTVNSSNCGVLTFDMGELTIDTQNGTSFSGIVLLQGTLDQSQIEATEELTGTVSADGSLSGTFIDTFYVDGVVASGGNGTFTGQFDEGELSLHVSGQDTYGSDCDHTTDVTFTRTTELR